MQVIITGIIRRPNLIQILKNVLVDVVVKWWRRLNLVIHRSMEIQRSADNVENLPTNQSVTESRRKLMKMTNIIF